MNDSEAHPVPLAVPHPGPVSSETSEGGTDVGARQLRASRLAPVVAALLLGAASLLLPLSWCGLWAPYELEVADFSRRIAVALHGAEELAIPGTRNDVPILSELGKGQLPFTSVALGFQAFGLSDWAGRLPIALWAALGLAATFVLVARLADRVAAAYAACALATMPLYFLHARTMLGDGVVLASVALATASLSFAVFDAGIGRRSVRLAWAVLGCAGLIAGFTTRGALIGVACPALGVGLGWASWRLGGRACPDRSSDAIGAAALAVGLLALGAGGWVLFEGSPSLYLELLGARAQAAGKLPTHDAVLHQLGFGLFPWSALAPFMLALTLYHPDGLSKDAALRLCLLGVFVMAVLVHGISAPYVGAVPFVGTFAVAGFIGLAFRDAEARGLPTRLLALCAAALLIIFYSDLRGAPEHSLRAFALPDAKFPESFAADAKRWIKYGSAAAIAFLLLGLGDLPAKKHLGILDRNGPYARWLSALRRAWRGRLPWVLVAITCLWGALPVLAALEARGVSLPFPRALGPVRALGRYAFWSVPVLVALPLAFWLGRDVIGALLARLPMPRQRLAFVGFAAFGLAMSLGYYPALAAHLSPRNVFESFRERAKPEDALAVLGQAARVAPYYATREVHTPASARDGLNWLLEPGETRRFLVLAARDLGQLNQLYRQRVQPPDNLPIIDATSSEVLLASNRLAPGEVNENPLARWISVEAPQPERPLENVQLNGQLKCLGWGVTDRDGRAVEAVRTGVPYEFKIYWEVLAPISGTWQTFIHIDGHRRRHNGDHDTLQGKYPFRFWQKGDFITDVHTFELEPHFAGATYQVYFGLFSGDKRLSVKSGRHQDDRIIGGSLVVR